MLADVGAASTEVPFAMAVDRFDSDVCIVRGAATATGGFDTGSAGGGATTGGAATGAGNGTSLRSCCDGAERKPELDDCGGFASRVSSDAGRNAGRAVVPGRALPTDGSMVNCTAK